MASSSISVCCQCKRSTGSDDLKNGWRLRSGGFAQLCPDCASVYEEGRFCKVFHWDNYGWRHCKDCSKPVHCSCIVSSNTYVMLDFGGIICMECSRRNTTMITSHVKNEDYFPSKAP